MVVFPPIHTYSPVVRAEGIAAQGVLDAPLLAKSRSATPREKETEESAAVVQSDGVTIRAVWQNARAQRLTRL